MRKIWHEVVAGDVKAAKLIKRNASEDDLQAAMKTLDLCEGTLRGEARIVLSPSGDGMSGQFDLLWLYPTAAVTLSIDDGSQFGAMYEAREYLGKVPPAEEGVTGWCLWMEVQTEQFPEQLRALLDPAPEPEAAAETDAMDAAADTEPPPCCLCGGEGGEHAGNCGDSPEPSEHEKQTGYPEPQPL